MLTPEIKAKLNDPAVKQAIAYWVMYVVNQLGQVKSEKVIKRALFDRLKGRISPLGIDYIYKLALVEFEHRRTSIKIAAEIVSTNGSHRSIQN